MRSLPPQLHTYRYENLIHIFISVLTCYSSYTSASKTKLPRTVRITHYNDHETQNGAYFLIPSPYSSPPLTSYCTWHNCHTYFKHFLQPVLRNTSHSTDYYSHCSHSVPQIIVCTVSLYALVVHGSDMRGSPLHIHAQSASLCFFIWLMLGGRDEIDVILKWSVIPGMEYS